MKLDIVTLENKKKESVELPKEIFELEPRTDILHQITRWQLAKRQAGTHKTKGISEIRGTTKKPWRQKGTGRARAGSLRAPQMRGGATIFGPVVRSHAFKLPKKVRQLGLKLALSVKARAGDLLLIENFDLKAPKTKDFQDVLGKLSIDNALFIDGAELSENFSRASSNVKNVDVLPVQGINVYDILRRKKLVLSKQAFESVKERLA
jgi:large subunit ribosomal protein L4